MTIAKTMYWAVLAGMALTLTGCASTSRTTMAMSGNTANRVDEAGRQVIKTANSEVTVAKLAAAVAAVEALMQQEQGLIASTALSGEKAAYLELRVPEKQLASILDKLAALGSEKYRHVSSRDVTEQVRDQETVLKNKQALRERLRDLLAKAKTVQDVIAVEEQLTRLQSEIENIEGQLRNTKNDVEYSLIQLQLSQQTVLGPLGYVAYGLWWVIEKLFVIQ